MEGKGIFILTVICLLCFFLGVQITTLILEYSLSETPTAMDVYQNKTILKYEIVDGIKIDSVVVFKNK